MFSVQFVWFFVTQTLCCHDCRSSKQEKTWQEKRWKKLRQIDEKLVQKWFHEIFFDFSGLLPNNERPGYESYRKTREDLTTMDKLHMALTGISDFTWNQSTVWKFQDFSGTQILREINCEGIWILVLVVIHLTI